MYARTNQPVTCTNWGGTEYGVFAACSCSTYIDDEEVIAKKRYVGAAAGGYHTVLLRSDGSAVGVGRDDFGQAACPPGAFAAAAAGAFHTVLLRADGSAVAFGHNEYGQAQVARHERTHTQGCLYYEVKDF